MAGRAKIGKLDIDESPDIYRGLGVNGVPHILFFKDGEEQDRIAAPRARDLRRVPRSDDRGEVGVRRLGGVPRRRRVPPALRGLEAPSRTWRRRSRSGRICSSNRSRTGQTPLSLILNSSSVRQDDQIALVLRDDPVISTADLVGLGRCDELQAALADDPEAASRPDPDGASPLWVALMRSHRLEDRSCLRNLLDAGADPSREQADRYHFARPVVLREDVELLREFLDRGMDPESTNNDGYNALHWASVYGMVDGAQPAPGARGRHQREDAAGPDRARHRPRPAAEADGNPRRGRRRGLPDPTGRDAPGHRRDHHAAGGLVP